MEKQTKTLSEKLPRLRLKTKEALANTTSSFRAGQDSEDLSSNFYRACIWETMSALEGLFPRNLFQYLHKFQSVESIQVMKNTIYLFFFSYTVVSWKITNNLLHYLLGGSLNKIFLFTPKNGYKEKIYQHFIILPVTKCLAAMLPCIQPGHSITWDSPVLPSNIICFVT